MLSILLALLNSVSAGPCDIYAQGGTACVAAHSTTRALFSAYNGPLYQIQRASDKHFLNVSTLSAGGIANAASQDTFCASTSCSVIMIFDQTTYHNDLKVMTNGTGGGGYGGPSVNQPGYHQDLYADATLAPVHLNGQKAYGLYIAQKTGYKAFNTTGVAKGAQSEGIYAVLDGTHYDNMCCFDYGNSEYISTDPPMGNGHMEAINFSNHTKAVQGAGTGPWIMAELENGLYAGNQQKTGVNPGNPSLSHRFVTAMVKGDGGNSNFWAIRGGDATTGTLGTFYAGVRPTPNYFPPHLEGSIILGVGGDNSEGGVGTFYEGAMTFGLPSNATENAVQANIIAAKYTT